VQTKSENASRPAAISVQSAGEAPMSAIEIVTPKLLAEYYGLLNFHDKKEFLELLGQRSVAESVYLMLGGLSLTEQRRFCMLWTWGMKKRGFFHRIVDHACKVVQEMPQLLKPENRAELVAKVQAFDEGFVETVRQHVAADQKRKRDRKNNPELVRRNVEICDRHLRGRSLGELAKEYRLSRGTIQGIVEKAAHWRSEQARIQRAVR
jgi:hypothetical protein